MKYLRGLGIAVATALVFLVCGALGLIISVSVAFAGYAIAGAAFLAFVAYGFWEAFLKKPRKPLNKE